MGLAPVFLQFLCVLSVLGGKIDTHLNGYPTTHNNMDLSPLHYVQGRL